MTQKLNAKSLNTYVTTTAKNKLINQDVQLNEARKHNVHQILPRYVAQPCIFSRTLYENYLVDDKWKYIVTFDEVWVYLNDFKETKRKKNV